MPRKKVTASEVVSVPAAAPKAAAKKVTKPRTKSTTVTHKSRTTAAKKAAEVKPEITAQQIADRAYYLWLERGCPMGSQDEDWFRAEAELLTVA